MDNLINRSFVMYALKRAMGDEFDESMDMKTAFIAIAMDYYKRLPERPPYAPLCKPDGSDLFKMETWLNRIGEMSFRMCDYSALFEFAGEHALSGRMMVRWQDLLIGSDIFNDLADKLDWLVFKDNSMGQSFTPGAEVYGNRAKMAIFQGKSANHDWSFIG